MDYQAQAKKIRASGDKGFCVPFAISMVSEKPFDEINTQMIRTGIRQHKCGTYQSKWEPFIREMFNIEDVTDQVKARGAKTVKSAARVLTRGKYFVRVRNHLLAIVNGEVRDWTNGRQHRVLQVFQVIEDSQTPVTLPEVKPQPTAIKPQPVHRLMHALLEAGLPAECLTITGKWVKYDGLGFNIYFSPSRRGVQTFIKYNRGWGWVNAQLEKILGQHGEAKKAYITWYLELEQLSLLAV